MRIHYEYRTTKVPVAIFQSPQQARQWAQQRDPKYVASLKLVKVTTIIREEHV